MIISVWLCRFLWAKPSIEELLMTASERRLLFQEAEREELDELVTKMRTTQVRSKHYCDDDDNAA